MRAKHSQPLSLATSVNQVNLGAFARHSVRVVGCVQQVHVAVVAIMTTRWVGHVVGLVMNDVIIL